MTLGIQADHALVVERDDRDHVEVHRCRQRAAVLVVGVVAADLGPAGSGEELNVVTSRKDLGKAANGALIAQALGLENLGRGAVQNAQRIVCFSGVDRLE